MNRQTRVKTSSSHNFVGHCERLVSAFRLTNSEAKVKIKDKEIQSKDELHTGQILRGFVANSSQQGIFVRYVRTREQNAET